MNELLDKQLNAHKESFERYFWGSHKLPQAHKIVCNENERNKQEKNNVHVKMLRKCFIGCIRKTGGKDLDKILKTMKVLYLFSKVKMSEWVQR